MKVNLGKYIDGNANRTVKVVIHDYDTWSLDYSLALIILPALIQLRQAKSGAPGEFIRDISGDPNSNQRSFDFHAETYNETVDEAIEKWKSTLDKMIWSFHQLIRDDYSKQYHHGEIDMAFEPTMVFDSKTSTMSVFNQIVDKNPDEHWYDRVGHDLHQERIQEGLELFGKYYRQLWD
jgi:hypothetical protein